MIFMNHPGKTPMDRSLNQGYAYTESIDGRSAGSTVIEHLSRAHRHSSHDRWLKRVGAGEVRLNGFAVTSDRLLKRGDRLTWMRPPWREPVVPLGFALLYRDDDVIVVAKPRGLPTVPAGGRFLEHTLVRQMLRRFPGTTPVHRLDAPTSGAVLCARTEPARRFLGGAFRTGGVERIYLGLLEGRAEQCSFVVGAPIGPVPHPLLGDVHAAERGGRRAETLFEVVEQRADSFVARIELHSGRPHQIRIHAAWAGHPLLGENLYLSGGRPAPASRARPTDCTVHLHAWRISFPHPCTRRWTAVECPPPPLLSVPSGSLAAGSKGEPPPPAVPKSPTLEGEHRVDVEPMVALRWTVEEPS